MIRHFMKHGLLRNQNWNIHFNSSLTRKFAKQNTPSNENSTEKNAIETPSLKRKAFELMMNTWMDIKSESTDYPEVCDVVVVGGGAMGSSVAYWIKQKAYKGLSVSVFEKDSTYCKASTTLSVGGLRQQFSLPENIEMSLYGAEFIRNINAHLGVAGEPPIDVDFHPKGYLTLATDAGAQTLIDISKLQNSLGAKNTILNKKQMKVMFPWLNNDDIAIGCLGLQKEGWFDPWSLLQAFKKKAISIGAKYYDAEVIGFEFTTVDGVLSEHTETGFFEKPNKIIVKTKTGETKMIKFSLAVVAGGAYSGQIGKMLRIGSGTGALAVPLPVEPRKRYVYCFHCPEDTGLNTPLTIDPTGTYFRKDGLAGNYICGQSPPTSEEPSVDNLDVDHEYFDNKIWPVLAQRVKAFENLKVKSSWAGFYEYNTYDKNGIIGQHPIFSNIFFATGFSGHGIQQSPAVGRAISELIIDGEYLTIDLTRFEFDRFIRQIPVREVCIV